MKKRVKQSAKIFKKFTITKITKKNLAIILIYRFRLEKQLKKHLTNLFHLTFD